MSAATVDGYRQEKVTLQELFSGGRGKIKEPSVKALRQRALDGILVYLDSSGPTQYFDRRLSEIRHRAARSCKKPGITWRNITRAFREADSSDAINQSIIQSLNSSTPEQVIAKTIAALISEKLERY